MILLNPIMLGGLAAIAVPIAVHIIHQRKVTLHRWGAMRFLHDMMAKSRSRLLMDQWLLMAVRTAAVLCLVLALNRPAWEPSGGADRVQRMGSTAAVILVDDSLSAGAGRVEPRMRRMRELVGSYLDTLDEGAEVSLITLSDLGTTADPLFDIEAVRERVAAIEPTDMGSDHAALLRAGIAQLDRHVNPNVEVVLVSDALRDGWRSGERVRWTELRERLQRDPDAVIGTRNNPRLVLLSPGDSGRQSNLAVRGLDLDRSIIAADQDVAITVGIDHHGDADPTAAVLRLQIDGRTIDERELRLARGGSRTLVFTHRFADPGSHVIEALIEGARDDLAADDRRALAVEVVRGLPVLLVEGRSGPGLSGSGAFLAAALDPAAGGGGLFAIERIPSTQLSGIRLDHYRAVVLCDVPALDAGALSALERYVAEGGGVLVGLGPATDAKHVNRLWAREGEGFLPCPVGALEEPDRPMVPRVEATAHRAMAPFAGSGGEAWGSAQVRLYRRLETDAVARGELTSLVALENGDPLAVLRRRGLGQVVLVAQVGPDGAQRRQGQEDGRDPCAVATSLDLAWTELPVRAAFVPLVRGIVGHLGGQILPPRNLNPGQRIAFVRARSVTEPQAASPDGTPVVLAPDTWEGRQVFASPPVSARGVYTVHDDERTLHFTVGVEARESALELATEREIDEALGEIPRLDLRSGEDIATTFTGTAAGDLELWRYLIIGCLGLLFVETWLTRRQSRGERGAA